MKTLQNYVEGDKTLLAIKGLGLLIIACLCIIIIGGLLYVSVRWAYEVFLSDIAKIEKLNEELNEIVTKYEEKEIK